MLENEIKLYENEVQKATQKLLDKVQPLVNNFCKKYELTFISGMGNFSFSFCKNGESDNYVDELFLDELDPDLFTLLNHELEDRSVIGELLDNCYQQVTELVYIHRDHETNNLTIHKEASDLFSVDSYGAMSLKLANNILRKGSDVYDLLEFY